MQIYETSHYKERSCLIDLQDGRKVRGRSFLRNADGALLKEDTFDLKDWRMNKLGLRLSLMAQSGVVVRYVCE